MLKLVTRRLIQLVPLLLGLSIVVFAWVRALPGGPATSLLGADQQGNAAASGAEIDRLYGLDRPLYHQYLTYLDRLAHLDLGQSIATRRPVAAEIGRRFPATVELAGAALIVAVGVGVPVGYLAARHRRRWFDHGSLATSVVALSVPVFFLGFLLKYVFVVRLGWLPGSGRMDVTREVSHPTGLFVLDAVLTLDGAALVDAVRHLVLPGLALGVVPLAFIARITRASVLEVLDEDYVRTARAGGLSRLAIARRGRPAQRPAAGGDGRRPDRRVAAVGRGAGGGRLRLGRDGIVPPAGDRRPGLPGAPGRRSPAHGPDGGGQPGGRGRPRPARPAGAGRMTGRLARRLGGNRAAMAGAVLVGLFVVVAVLAPLLAPHNPTAGDLGPIRPGVVPGPSAHHLMGLDLQGRDVLSRVVYGARYSLLIGLASVALGVALGSVVGALAGGLGGWVDTVLMRAMDAMLAIPGLLLAIGVVTLLGPRVVSVTVAMGIGGAPLVARLLRGAIVGQQPREYVTAARALGASRTRVIVHHLLPNSLAPVLVGAPLAVGGAILEAAGLSFLGLGAGDPSLPEWGRMLAESSRALQSSPHVVLFPGLALILAVLGFNLLGDGLREALDPRLAAPRPADPISLVAKLPVQM